MYEVGQVLYVLMKKEHTVIPVRVVEKILMIDFLKNKQLTINNQVLVRDLFGFILNFYSILNFYRKF